VLLRKFFHKNILIDHMFTYKKFNKGRLKQYSYNKKIRKIRQNEPIQTDVVGFVWFGFDKNQTNLVHAHL